MQDKVNYYLYKSNQFPTLPTIYTSLIQVVSNSRSTIQDLAEVILKDQASVVKLLKVVNSSLYSLQGKVTTVNQAIFYLGFNVVKNVLLTLSVMEIFDKVNKSDKFNVVDLWKHSIAVGVIAKIIATKLQIKDTENFFVAGIIHDIGKLFFVNFFSDEYSKIIEKIQDTNIPISVLEIEVFGMSHEMIGSELAKKWNLPPILRNTIEYHDKGTISGKTELVLSCVHLANTIASLMKIGYSGDNSIPQLSFEIWNMINLPEGSFKDMYSTIISTYTTANNILSLK
jgi:putative nucleotidyltransferase with HDIG domain